MASKESIHSFVSAGSASGNWWVKPSITFASCHAGSHVGSHVGSHAGLAGGLHLHWRQSP
jgi:hypothetical protein